MKLALCLFKYFPFGGLQRDFLRIAKECVKRGHTVHVYTAAWEGVLEPGLAIHILPLKGIQNHTRNKNFVRELQPFLLKEQYDCVVGFNKMPNLDVYYAADVCYQTKKKSFLKKILPHYRHLAAYEKAVFSEESCAKILSLSSAQQNDFIHFYRTSPKRFYLLPPGIARDRVSPANAAEIRAHVRQELNIGEQEFLLLMVGSGFKTKGLDRVLSGVAALPEDIKKHSQLYVIGQDNPALFLQQAKKIGIADRVTFLGGRDDVPRFLLAADLLLHPAYHENTGTVLLEAIVSGLPVLTTDVCGYAEYVQKAQAGRVLSSPFQQSVFNQCMLSMLLSPEREKWRQNGIMFAEDADIYSMPERAVDMIETMKQKLFFSFDEAMAARGEVFRELENRRTQRIKLNDKAFFLKQHFGVGWKEIFKNLLQLRLPVLSAKNEWRALQRLKELNVLAPEVVSHGCRGMNPASRQSFLITRELPSHVSLEDFCRDWPLKPPHFSVKYQLIKKIAEIARTLHENGMNHRDFYICHFLQDTSGQLYLIDLHRAGIRKHIPVRWAIKDLAGLYFSSKDIGLSERDILRFVREYRKKPLRPILRLETVFWKKVKKRGDRLYRKHTK